MQFTRLNTLKTVAGYLYSLLERLLPVRLSRASISGVYNYLPISEQITTSGQPTEAQLLAIRDAGYATVINLAPANVENALPDEAASLATIDLPYIHIPVNFKAPSEANFSRFIEAMQGMEGQKVWVHCAANMRVSAFMYRYRCEVLGEEPSIAQRSLNKIWEPIGVWRQFVDNVDNKIDPGS
ncbi:MAG: protein tyrosine phosphatase family protein [Pseudomonadota bacterium]